MAVLLFVVTLMVGQSEDSSAQSHAAVSRAEILKHQAHMVGCSAVPTGTAPTSEVTEGLTFLAVIKCRYAHQ